MLKHTSLLNCAPAHQIPLTIFKWEIGRQYTYQHPVSTLQTLAWLWRPFTHMPLHFDYVHQNQAIRSHISPHLARQRALWRLEPFDEHDSPLPITRKSTIHWILLGQLRGKRNPTPHQSPKRKWGSSHFQDDINRHRSNPCKCRHRR